MEGRAHLQESSISQYALGAQGTSACTAIACHAAAAILALVDAGAPITTPALDAIVRAGVEVSALDAHMDFPNAWMLSGLEAALLPLNMGAETQGLLTTPGALEELCAAARAQARGARPGAHVAVVLTKPPETVCLILPPEGGAGGGRFVLFDSHPRVGVPHAYAFEAATQAGLLQRVREVLPPLPPEGDDEEAVMAVAMYNMFEGTFLVQRGEGGGGAPVAPP